MDGARASLSGLLARGDAVLDGGLATELEARGHDLRDELWSARVLRDEPEAIAGVHRSYFEAGADVAITSSYQATDPQLLERSVELARRARDEVKPDGLVVGSVGPYAVVLADGSEYTGDYGDVDDETIAATQRARLQALVAAGADAIAFETIPNGREAAIVAALLDELPDVEAWLSFCCRDGARLSDGTRIDEAIRQAGSRPTAFGINCTPPQHVASLLELARRATDKPLVVYPNHGRTWNEATYTWSGEGVGDFSPALVGRWRGLGAAAVGGCCGIGPEAIAGLARLELPADVEPRTDGAERLA